MDELAGKHAVVTGGGRGIGAAIAAALLASGARVTIAGRDAVMLAATARRLSAQGTIAAMALDVADGAAVRAAFAGAGRSEQEARAELAAGNPQKRLVEVDEVANAVLWLCLPRSAAMNGQALAVAGGEIM